MKAFILITLLATTSFAQTAAKPLTEYDRFKNRTTVYSQTTVKPSGEYAILFDNVAMLAGFFHPGDTLKEAAPFVDLSFTVKSRNWQFLESHRRTAYFIADGKRYEFPGNPRHSGRAFAGSRYSPGGVVETVTIVIPTADLREIFAAKSVEMKIGNMEVAFTDTQKALIANVVDAATPK